MHSLGTATAGSNAHRRTTGERITVAVVVALIVAGPRLLVRNLELGHAGRAGSRAQMPQSPAMEDQLGIRFSRVAVVGDGGLVTVTYVVLDSEKAASFRRTWRTRRS